jgi:hypothetical protein
MKILVLNDDWATANSIADILHRNGHNATMRLKRNNSTGQALSFQRHYTSWKQSC